MSEAKHTPGPYFWFKQPGKTPEEVQSHLDECVRMTVEAGLFTPDLHGVGVGDANGNGEWLVVCHTGCGPASAANAELIARALDCHDELLAALKHTLRAFEILYAEAFAEKRDLVRIVDIANTVISSQAEIDLKRVIAKAEGRNA